jgi:hypothetical protein
VRPPGPRRRQRSEGAGAAPCKKDCVFAPANESNLTFVNVKLLA